MRKSEKQGFLHGAAVLAASSAAVKVAGACFKIPVGAILGPEGMACFSIAYNIYALLFVLATAGVPVAVSKMISEACALGRRWEAERIFRLSRRIFAAIGAAGSAVMYFGADALAQLSASPGSAPAIRAVSPAVLLVAFSAVGRGYHQGLSDMYPTAISQLAEAFGKLVFGLGAAWFMSKGGFGTGAVAAGAVSGVSVGALVSTLYLAVVRRGAAPRPKFSVEASARSIARELVRLSVPITVSAAVISLSGVIDSALVMRLLGGIGYAERESMWLFGAYSYACNLYNLPNSVITTLGVSLIPSVSAAKAKGDTLRLQSVCEGAVRIAMCVAIPAAAGLAVLAKPIMHLLYGASISREAVELSGTLLAYLAAAIPAMGTASVTAAVHQACGNVRLPMVSMLCGAAVKLASNYFLVRIPQINIKGAAISTVLCYTIIAVINCIALKGAKIPFKPARVYLKPAACALCASAAAHGVFTLFFRAAHAKIGVLCAIAAGVFACAVCALLLGIAREEGLKRFFKGTKISKFLNIH